MVTGAPAARVLLVVAAAALAAPAAADRFATLMAQGKDAISTGRPAEAEKLFKEALKEDPGHPEALYATGYAVMRQGRNAVAIQYFEDVLKRTYALRDYQVFHTLALTNIGNILLGEGRYGEAERVFEKGEINVPGNVEVLTGYGAALRGVGKNEKALLKFEEALKIDPTHVGALVGKASIYYDLGNVPQAYDLLDGAVRSSPRNPLPYGVMSSFYRDMEKPYEGHMTLGHYYFYAGDVGRAVDQYRAALAINEAAEAYHTLGTAVLQMGRAQEAENLLNRALAMKVDPAAVTWAQLSMAQSAQEKNEEALKSIRRALKLSEKEPTYHAHLSRVLVKLGDLKGGERAARRALELDPDSADAYRRLGDVHNLRREGRQAVEMYEKCLVRSPDQADVYVNLGWAYELIDDPVSARRNYETFLRMQPDAPEAEKVREQIKKLEKKEKPERRRGSGTGV